MSQDQLAGGALPELAYCINLIFDFMLLALIQTTLTFTPEKK